MFFFFKCVEPPFQSAVVTISPMYYLIRILITIRSTLPNVNCINASRLFKGCETNEVPAKGPVFHLRLHYYRILVKAWCVKLLDISVPYSWHALMKTANISACILMQFNPENLCNINTLLFSQRKSNNRHAWWPGCTRTYLSLYLSPILISLTLL